MGLDTTHDCWHGGYISFDAVFRESLARAAGWPQDGAHGAVDGSGIKWDAITEVRALIDYARERAAREACIARLPKADGVDGVLSLTCRYDESGMGTWEAEASIFEGNILRGDTPRARAAAPVEAYLALAAALETK